MRTMVLCFFLLLGVLAFITLPRVETVSEAQNTFNTYKNSCASFCTTIGYVFIGYTAETSSCFCVDPDGCKLHGTVVTVEKLVQVGTIREKYEQQIFITNITPLPCK